MESYSMFCFVVWLFSFSVIILRSIFAVLSVSNLLFITEQYSIVLMYHNLFISSLVNGYLGCFLCVLSRSVMSDSLRPHGL